METGKMSRDTYDPNEIFLKYQKEIATNPIYAGMPDLYCDDGTIQWEAPSNRLSGKFKDTHDKRLKWWKRKAQSVGISTRSNQWISKTAKLIHPTKLRPCKKCGRIMDIRYIYLSNNLIKRVEKLKDWDKTVQIDGLTSIHELCAILVNMYGETILKDISQLLKCKQFPKIPSFTTFNDLKKWLDETYIPAEPSTLGPGAMSNAPDRLDGFHSFNRCCRGTADKGRAKSNLASYTTDRRAFEFWSDGNWITANHLMGMIASDPELRTIPCFRSKDGGFHSLPCTADHIGPISLGFVHRPTFQLLCKACNSAKNNRMYFSDVQSLITAERNGETVASWYAKPIWDILKGEVSSIDDALKLSRIMRDNRFNAMLLLGEFLNRDETIFMTGLLNLHYADYDYENPRIAFDGNHIVTAQFDCKVSNTRFVLIQKARKIRVAFSSLKDYLAKEQRNGLRVSCPENEKILSECVRLLAPLNSRHKGWGEKLSKAIKSSNATDDDFEEIAGQIPCLIKDSTFIRVKSNTIRMMNNIAVILSQMWNDDRYARDI